MSRFPPLPLGVLCETFAIFAVKSFFVLEVETVDHQMPNAKRRLLQSYQRQRRL